MTALRAQRRHLGLSRRRARNGTVARHHCPSCHLAAGAADRFFGPRVLRPMPKPSHSGTLGVVISCRSRRWRRDDPAAAVGVPAHVTVLYPFRLVVDDIAAPGGRRDRSRRHAVRRRVRNVASLPWRSRLSRSGSGEPRFFSFFSIRAPDRQHPTEFRDSCEVVTALAPPAWVTGTDRSLPDRLHDGAARCTDRGRRAAERGRRRIPAARDLSPADSTR